jgi:hypothetical protein
MTRSEADADQQRVVIGRCLNGMIAVNLPIRLTRTDRNGDFLFRRVAPGRYMIEVSQGLHILYRVEIDSTRQSRLDIPLQRQR